MLRNITLYAEADYAAMSRKAAGIFAETVKENPTAAYGFATGSTPEGMYEELVRLYGLGADFTGITTFNLDEYHPIKPDDPQSYYYYMKKRVFDPLGIRKFNLPDGTAPDPSAECIAYEHKLANAGEMAMQILGIGNNGHIGFNEPSDTFACQAGYVPLAADTISANSRFFEDPGMVPRNALTMGLHAIMMAKRILLLASGEGKAQILAQALTGPITPQVPASILQLHPCVTVVADKSAASLLK
ncbi:MAG: glucosamine-6-phosphate deaminase [Defluviitaleaceae bacterium]|nr:glucosamine-6-phosphate deaminase [Defluviitaleaceae bacterium]